MSMCYSSIGRSSDKSTSRPSRRMHTYLSDRPTLHLQLEAPPAPRTACYQLPSKHNSPLHVLRLLLWLLVLILLVNYNNSKNNSNQHHQNHNNNLPLNSSSSIRSLSTVGMISRATPILDMNNSRITPILDMSNNNKNKAMMSTTTIIPMTTTRKNNNPNTSNHHKKKLTAATIAIILDQRNKPLIMRNQRSILLLQHLVVWNLETLVYYVMTQKLIVLSIYQQGDNAKRYMITWERTLMTLPSWKVASLILWMTRTQAVGGRAN